ncbi:MAG: endonuclease/exonuclease/phosphatase family protein [Solirubrobacteraceae bacterium]|nr:endonuclease/exonuclease/phosphatase family protein [Solirubrobacteraceae bacterium]
MTQNLRILTWNLFHGRAVPPAGRNLLPEFTEHIAAWDWDVALLQEVPPWWPEPVARAAGAEQRTVLTSRNALLPLRRALAERWPDVIKSNGGGANAILVRGQHAITAHRHERLRRRPERRMVHGVRLDDGTWIANLHAQVRPHSETRIDLARAGAAAHTWAGTAPAILGGDCNVPDPAIDGFARLGGRGVDHVLGRGFTSERRPEIPNRDALSDHAAVIVDVRREHG